MKKKIALLLTLCLLLTMVTGCSKEEPSLQETLQQDTTPGTQQPASEPEAVPETSPELPKAEEIGGELYDAGNVTMLVPDGWKAFPDLDVFSDVEGATNPDVLNVSKGGQSDFDLFTKPYVRIAYFGPNVQMMEPDAEWYENVAATFCFPFLKQMPNLSGNSSCDSS